MTAFYDLPQTDPRFVSCLNDLALALGNASHMSRSRATTYGLDSSQTSYLALWRRSRDLALELLGEDSPEYARSDESLARMIDAWTARDYAEDAHGWYTLDCCHYPAIQKQLQVQGLDDCMWVYYRPGGTLIEIR